MLSLQVGVTNPVLRRASDVVEKELFQSSFLLSIIQYMREVMRKYGGVGISAPQVGINKQIILVTQWGERNGKKYCMKEIVMVNPHVIGHTEALSLSEEGCVSLPGIFGKVRRYEKIVVSYLDIFGKKQKGTYSGFTSYIIQHEIDHLQGILFVDKMVEEIKK